MLSGILSALTGIMQFNAPLKIRSISGIISAIGAPDNIYIKFSNADEAFFYLGP